MAEHERARTWLDDRLSGIEGVGLPWASPTPEPTHRHPEILNGLLSEADRPAHIPDAHLAALAIEYGLTLQTTDRDFARFGGLKWENPLERADVSAPVNGPLPL